MGERGANHAPGKDGEEELDVADARRTWPRKPSEGDRVSSFGTKCRAAIFSLSQLVIMTVPSAEKAQSVSRVGPRLIVRQGQKYVY